jgi:DNA ligase 1
MRTFAALLERLYYTYGNRDKARILTDYLKTTPDPDRGYALAIIAGTLDMPHFKRAMVRDLIVARVDPVLVEMSYDYVGELSETVAHLWPGKVSDKPIPSLSQMVTTMRALDKDQLRDYAASMLDVMDSPQRWAFLKISSSDLRIGVSARFLKQVLAALGNRDVGEIEAAWHGVVPPYEDLFAWIEGRGPTPALRPHPIFHPVMLSHPLEEKDFPTITPEVYSAEWKYDGIRVQLVAAPQGSALYSRTGDDIGGSFPDVLQRVKFNAVLDGELLVRTGASIGSFNDLQQRLNRKTPSRKLIETAPGHIILYDLLSADGEDLRGLPFIDRRSRLESWFEKVQPTGMELSPLVPFSSIEELARHRLESMDRQAIEGLMLKRKDSLYIAGRPSGLWYKWKREPRLVDAVLMYAQRGHGKRSSLYSDYTFGLWKGEELLPIGKAYFGFTDAELKELDKWVRHHTIQSFGPVREVSHELVVEVAFDAVRRSSRHKSGFALRFPRINRIRWDKPAGEADRLEVLNAMV